MSAGPEDEQQQNNPQRRASDHGERRQDQRQHRETGTPRYLDPGDTVFSLWGRVIMARYRRIAAAATRHIIQRPLHIGVSARIFHPEPGATGLRSKNLQYLEESIAQWVMSRDVLVFMIPTVNTDGLLHPSNIRLRDYAKHLDGLVLQGAPTCRRRAIPKCRRAPNGAATAHATCTSWNCCMNLSRPANRCWASAGAAS